MFWQFFSWNQSCQQLKSPKPQHFHKFFTQKKSTIFSGNQSWIFGQKWRFRTVCNEFKTVSCKIHILYEMFTLKKKNRKKLERSELLLRRLHIAFWRLEILTSIFLNSFFFCLPFRYLPVMKEFSGTASVRLAELEDLFVDMKARVSNL